MNGRFLLTGLEASAINSPQTPLARRALLRGLALLAYPALSAPLSSVTANADDAPIPVTLPLDDGPHDALIEWWYYTGHLFTDPGDRYGFEFVVFKLDSGTLLGYASHFAITDNTLREFAYDQRLSLGPQPTPAVSSPGFELAVGGWSMSGAEGHDQLQASMDGYAIGLQLEPVKRPILHDGDGFFDYGGGQGSYYYSRTRIEVTGELTVGDQSIPVTGDAWFDHQWGNFTLFEDGGWDWFALQLDDRSEIMLYLITDMDGATLMAEGSLISPDGTLTSLHRNEFVIEPSGAWTSDMTGITYPSGWNIEIAFAGIVLELNPALLNQELDTTATTRVIYWEGEVTVEGTKADEPIAGLGYVELTGYANR